MLPHDSNRAHLRLGHHLISRLILLLPVVIAIPAAAHTISMSTGELRITGTTAEYELRIPMYEVEHARDRDLLKHVRFRSAGADAQILSESCAVEGEVYICRARMRFAGASDQVGVRCTLARATVPNHVHLLRAHRGDRLDQAAFDAGFEDASLRFRELTDFERAARALAPRFAALGFWMATSLVLLALATAGRNSRDAWVLTCIFLGAFVVAGLSWRFLPWQLAPRFLEAAAALASAYVATEVLLLPQTNRSLTAAVLGIFAGLYVDAVMRTAVLSSLWIAVPAILMAGSARGLGAVLPAKRIFAGLIVCVGLTWFLRTLL